MILTTVCVTDRIETGWRHIQWSAVDHRADHLRIFECGRKNSVLFSADKARPESVQKAVWPQFLPQTNAEYAETVDKKCPNSKCPGAETGWKHAKRTRGQTHVSWGGRGRKFKSRHSDQVNGGCKSSVYLYFTRVFRTFGCGIFLYRASEKCSENSEKSSLYIIWYIGSNGAFHRSVEATA